MVCKQRCVPQQVNRQTLHSAEQKTVQKEQDKLTKQGLPCLHFPCQAWVPTSLQSIVGVFDINAKDCMSSRIVTIMCRHCCYHQRYSCQHWHLWHPGHKFDRGIFLSCTYAPNICTSNIRTVWLLFCNDSIFSYFSIPASSAYLCLIIEASYFIHICICDRPKYTKGTSSL